MNVSMEMPLSAGGNRKLFVIGRQFLLIKIKLGIEISVIQKSKGTISPSGSFQVLTGNGKK